MLNISRRRAGPTIARLPKVVLGCPRLHRTCPFKDPFSPGDFDAFPILLPTAALACALSLGCGDHRGVTDADPDAAPSFKAETNEFDTPFTIFHGLGGDQPVAALLGVSLEEFPAVCAGAESQ